VCSPLLQVLYRSGDVLHVMDQKTFEQVRRAGARR
jgi:translation elongation factor P/translation initiation factor 5A